MVLYFKGEKDTQGDKMKIKLEDANNIMSVACTKATLLNEKISIAIVDNEQHVVAINQMDEVEAIAFDKAWENAKNAVRMGANTHISKYKTKLEVVPDGGFILRERGEVVGAVGIYGASSRNTQLISEIALEVFEKEV